MSFWASFLYRQFFRYPPKPTASFKGKTIVVTGANVGLGKEAVRWFVQLGASQVILACRNLEKGQAAAKEIQLSTGCSPRTLAVWHLDMSSYDSVKAFSARVKKELPHLDALVGNAGISTTTFRMTEDNEETITTNVVSLTLLGCLLHPFLHETAVRFDTHTYFTVTSSELYVMSSFDERKAPDGQIFVKLAEKKPLTMERYRTSKLLEIFVVKQMAQIAPLKGSKVIINATAPGFCQSELQREAMTLSIAPLIRLLIKITARPTEVGARTIVYGASAGPKSHGQYVPDCEIHKTAGLTAGDTGAKLQERVWTELKEKLEKIEPGCTAL